MSLLCRYTSKWSIVFTLKVLTTVLLTSRAAVIANKAQAMIYLSKYGYLSTTAQNTDMISDDSLKEAIREFQSFAGIKITGELDEETTEFMNRPRCGVIDIVGSSRRKRYVLQGSKWKKKDLTYKISKYPSTLDRDVVDKVMKEALTVWSEVTPLTFTEKRSGSVNIEIKFERGEHGDRYPFDGPDGSYLAHASFPHPFGGHVHFNDEEKWTVNSTTGFNLFNVAVHEFGHTLGLDHSKVPGSVMKLRTEENEPNFRLSSDDITAIQMLYGERMNKPPPDEEDSEEWLNYESGSGHTHHKSSHMLQMSLIIYIYLAYLYTL